ncbi:MAG: hydantoinase/oxoprolinase family protein [Anaerolineaceae bacterium]|nr:hydantoinase/oxoprolinase family protein [Anaerolineaceae bacterium]
MINIVGWDIGGANVKAAWLVREGNTTRIEKVASLPFEIWKERDRLPEVLGAVLKQINPETAPQAMAVTMTAELADIFTTKREGVLFVLESLLTKFPDYPGYALNLAGDFVPFIMAKQNPLDFAAANWLATAKWIAKMKPDCLVIDVGSTTTDILPILGGLVCTSGRTDLDRLTSGELVYSGVLRTNLAAIVRSVPIKGNYARVSSEYFAISGDVHLILGHLTPEDYDCPTPDGRPPSLLSSQQRLARLVCSDSEQLAADDIHRMASYIYSQQIQQICEAVQQVLSRLPDHNELPIIAFGSGRFIVLEVAKRLGMEVREVESIGNTEASAVAPCVAAGFLLADQIEAAL